MSFVKVELSQIHLMLFPFSGAEEAKLLKVEDRFQIMFLGGAAAKADDDDDDSSKELDDDDEVTDLIPRTATVTHMGSCAR